MAICASGEKLSQEATGIRRGRVYPVDKIDSQENIQWTDTSEFVKGLLFLSKILNTPLYMQN